MILSIPQGTKDPSLLCTFFGIFTNAGQDDLALSLFERGLTAETRDPQGNTPLHFAVSQGNLALMKRIEEKWASSSWLAPFKAMLWSFTDVANANGWTPLHLAATYNFHECAQWLISKRAPLEALDKEGSTPLLCACSRGSNECVALLLEAGAEVRTVNKEGVTPLEAYVCSSNTLGETANRLQIKDRGWTEEIGMRKLLGHRFGLAGSTTIGRGDGSSYQIPIEGFHLVESCRHLVTAALPFYSQLQDKAKDWHHALDAESWNRLAVRVYATLHRAISIKEESPQGLYEALQRGQPIAYPTYWNDESGSHAVAFVLFSWDGAYYLCRCNKGQHHGGKPGIRIQSISPQKESHLPEFFERCHSLSPAFFLKECEDLLGLTNEIYIPQKEQKVGNCTVANTNSMELALWYAELLVRLEDTDEAATLAKRVQKARTHDTRTGTLHEYLKLHPNPKEEAYPPDIILIANAIGKSVKEPEEEPVRHRLVIEWAKKYGLQLPGID